LRLPHADSSGFQWNRPNSSGIRNPLEFCCSPRQNKNTVDSRFPTGIHLIVLLIFPGIPTQARTHARVTSQVTSQWDTTLAMYVSASYQKHSPPQNSRLFSVFLWIYKDGLRKRRDCVQLSVPGTHRNRHYKCRPTFATLQVVQVELNANAASVHSNRGDGLTFRASL
jgi:hypothetical protein